MKRHFHCSYTDLGVLKDFIQDNSFITTQHQDTQLIKKGQLVYKKKLNLQKISAKIVLLSK